MAKRKIAFEVTMKFTEEEVNELLATAASFNEGDPLTFAEISKNKKALELLVDEFDPGNIKEEFIDGSYEAIANDWLCEFGVGGSVYEMFRDEEDEEEDDE